MKRGKETKKMKRGKNKWGEEICGDEKSRGNKRKEKEAREGKIYLLLKLGERKQGGLKGRGKSI